MARHGVSSLIVMFVAVMLLLLLSVDASLDLRLALNISASGPPLGHEQAPGYGDQCTKAEDCKYPLLCCGCAWRADERRGVCLYPNYDQCNWEFGCLTEQNKCGCAHSECEPYYTLPCHNKRQSYACRSYDESERGKKCGYGRVHQ